MHVLLNRLLNTHNSLNPISSKKIVEKSYDSKNDLLSQVIIANFFLINKFRKFLIYKQLYLPEEIRWVFVAVCSFLSLEYSW